jgi:hypothetical protein
MIMADQAKPADAIPRVAEQQARETIALEGTKAPRRAH